MLVAFIKMRCIHDPVLISFVDDTPPGLTSRAFSEIIFGARVVLAWEVGFFFLIALKTINIPTLHTVPLPLPIDVWEDYSDLG